MKVVVLLACLVGVAMCAPQQTYSKSARVLEEEEEEIIDTPEPYQFALAVADDESTNYQSRTESQDENGVVKGQYQYVGPDGIRRIVSYSADPINGYQVTTQEEQTNIEIVFPKPFPLDQQAGFRKEQQVSYQQQGL